MTRHPLTCTTALFIPAFLLAAESVPDKPAGATGEVPPAATPAAHAPAASAQPESDSRQPAPLNIAKEKWVVGAGIAAGPAYPGASKYWVLPVPLINYDSGTGFFASPIEGIGFKADTGTVVVGIAGRYDLTRRNGKDDPRFEKWEDIDGAPALNLFGEYRFGRNFVKANLVQRITKQSESGGYTHLEFGRTMTLSDTGADLLQVGAYADWMDGNYANTFFEITPEQAATSGLPVYKAGRNFANTGLFVNYIRRIDAHWGAFIRLTANQLRADAADSPLVRSKTFGTALFSLAYQF